MKIVILVACIAFAAAQAPGRLTLQDAAGAPCRLAKTEGAASIAATCNVMTATASIDGNANSIAALASRVDLINATVAQNTRAIANLIQSLAAHKSDAATDADLDQIRSELLNITLTPGPKGERGTDGSHGAPGAKGEAGATGSDASVSDLLTKTPLLHDLAHEYCALGTIDTMTHECVCNAGYEGGGAMDAASKTYPACTDVDECASGPCENMGVCSDSTTSSAVAIAAFACDCAGTGYTGTTCGTNIDECTENNPCQNNGACTDKTPATDGVKYTCDCAGTGFEGTTCAVDTDECASSPCQSDETCVESGSTGSTVSPGQYRCDATFVPVSHQQEKWCNGGKTHVSQCGYTVTSHGDLSAAAAVNTCASNCEACSDCAWFGFRKTDNYCEYWTSNSCANPHSESNHDIYQVKGATFLSHQQEKWCNGGKTHVSQCGYTVTSHGDLSAADAIATCKSNCLGCSDCAWFGFRKTDNYCEYWTSNSCANPHSESNHDIYRVK